MFLSYGTEISHEEAFSDANLIIDVELNKLNVDAVNAKAKTDGRQDQVKAFHASALEFNPRTVTNQDVDVVILLNQQIPVDVPVSYAGKYVLCNDYHSAVTQMRRKPDFKLVGIIRANPKNEGKSLFLDTESTDDYWKEITTEEELRQAPFSWGTTNYEEAAKAVEIFTGKRGNILAEYKKLLERAEKDGFGLSDGSYLVTYKNRQISLTPLPRKKGTVDDIFVFERVKQE